MLNTIREYAVERLEEEGDPDAARGRHADWFLALVDAEAGHMMDADKGRHLDTLEREHDNLRAAITWATDGDHAEMALRLSSALWRFWQMRGYLVEGRERLDRALALPDAVNQQDARLAAFEAAGGIAYWQGDGLSAQRLYQASLDLARAAGNPDAEANAEYNLSFAFMYSPDSGSGEERALLAREHAHAALEIYRRIGDRAGEARTMWALSNAGWSSGQFDEESTQFAASALAAFRELDDRFQIGWASYTVALFALRNKELEEAARGLAESLEIFADAGDVSGYVLIIDAVALLAWVDGDRDMAARLSGAVAELERRTGTGLNPLNREVMEWEPEALADNPDTAPAWKSGTLLEPSDAVDAARQFLAAYLGGAATTRSEVGAT
jgi:hypothetical protein